jgi:hypothetical protein
MPDGGTLFIKTEGGDTDIQITVKDSGVGISESNLPKIFEPYFTTRESGSGLGLTLVFKIIREHRGEVSVKSREGEGSAFIISLPVPQRETRLIGFTESAEPRIPEGHGAGGSTRNGTPGETAARGRGPAGKRAGRSRP